MNRIFITAKILFSAFLIFVCAVFLNFNFVYADAECVEDAKDCFGAFSKCGVVGQYIFDGAEIAKCEQDSNYADVFEKCNDVYWAGGAEFPEICNDLVKLALKVKPVSPLACIACYDKLKTCKIEPLPAYTEFQSVCNGNNLTNKGIIAIDCNGFPATPSSLQCSGLNIFAAAVKSDSSADAQKCVDGTKECVEKMHFCLGANMSESDILSKCFAYVATLPNKAWNSSKSIEACKFITGVNDAKYAECNKQSAVFDKIKNGCLCPNAKEATPIDLSKSDEDKIGECCLKCQYPAEIKLKLKDEKCEGAPCRCKNGMMKEKVESMMNKKLQTKSCCDACSNDESVFVDGISTFCGKKIAVPAIEAYPNPVNPAFQNPSKFISNLIKVFLGIIGSVALAIIIYAGFLWLTSRGETGKVADAKNTMIWAVAGLVLVFSSYAIITFLFSSL